MLLSNSKIKPLMDKLAANSAEIASIFLSLKLYILHLHLSIRKRCVKVFLCFPNPVSIFAVYRNGLHLIF